MKKIEPVAWMTHHDEPMFFPTKEEAALYCAEGEKPIPLYCGVYRTQINRLQLQNEKLKQKNKELVKVLRDVDKAAQEDSFVSCLPRSLYQHI